jgi:phage-related baseplate assembly protein
MAGTTTSVDLSQLPLPTIVEVLDFETIVSAQLTDFAARQTAAGEPFTALLESDPAYKVIESAAYRELLLRQRVNDACKAIMLAYATKGDLDQIAANFDVQRLLISLGDPTLIPPTDDVYEDDTSLRRRVQLSFDGLTTAGPSGSYIFHALSASADVLDASAISEIAGTVIVSVLSRTGDGTAPSDTLAAVTAALNDETVRPLCDTVVVQSADVVDWNISATIVTFDGPDSAVVIASAQAAAQAYADAQHVLGRDITLSGVYAALQQPGVQNVVLASPLANIVISKKQAPNCTAITLVDGGVGD